MVYHSCYRYMINAILILCTASIAALAAALLISLFTGKKGIYSENRLLTAFFALSLISVTVYSYQFLIHVYMLGGNSGGTLFLYYLNLCAESGMIALAFLYTAGKTGGKRSVVRLTALLLFFLPLLLDLSSNRISSTQLPRLMRSAVYIEGIGVALFLFFSPGKASLHAKMAALIMTCVIAADAYLINFSISPVQYIPDGIPSYPAAGLLLGVWGSLTLTRAAYTRQGEGIQVSPAFIAGFSITPREQEIITCLLKGYNNAHISDELCISTRTVDTHFTNIYRKCGVKSRVELIKLLAQG